MIEKLRKIRQEKHLSQTQLARLSGVSQSLIARIEQGRVDPSYSKAMKILAALESKSKAYIKDIMNRHITTIDYNEEIEKAISIMKRKNISQLPVTQKEKIIGAVSESAIAMKKRGHLVKDIIEPSLPSLDINASIEVVRDLLKHSQAVIITQQGKPVGIITKTDLLRLV
ncbi:MAG: CBS domain-containing protein [Candidatus Aenigmarchaeota archaeon]|nr:CBS domain-containing protein [Candidatus Aenigmarchaeota archaeon]